MEIRFFKTPSDFRRWLERHHATERELWVGYYKKDSGKPSITWPESVDQALCFGWIDGIRKSIDDISYMSRFTPRQPRSPWSAVNIRRAEALIQQGLMRSAGFKAFEAHKQAPSTRYSYENAERLDEAYEHKLRENEKAWAFFQAQAPWYRRLAAKWVMSAKKEETRLRRLEALIDCSARECTIPPLPRPAGAKFKNAEEG